MCTNVNTLGAGADTNGLSVLTNPGGGCGAGTFDWSYWSVSSRTQWNITKDFYVGLEGFYGHLNTMSRARP